MKPSKKAKWEAALKGKIEKPVIIKRDRDAILGIDDRLGEPESLRTTVIKRNGVYRQVYVS
jgi:hypothetical protein